MLGEKKISVYKNSDISVDDFTYIFTSGLWSLKMAKVPRDYTGRDLEEYYNLVVRTNVIQHPRGIEEGVNRPLQTQFKKILNKFIEEDERDEYKEDEATSGSGIQFFQEI